MSAVRHIFVTAQIAHIHIPQSSPWGWGEGEGHKCHDGRSCGTCPCRCRIKSTL